MAKPKPKPKSPRPKPAASLPARFFEKELTGAQAPSFDTMSLLFARAAELLSREPWDLLEEDNLVLFEEPGAPDTCFCSVMGAARQAMIVQVYIGARSYFWFQKMHAGELTTVGEFFAHQYSVYVDFSDLAGLTPPDRQLARIMRHPLSRNTVAPIFRTIRPGYHPWYVTETEARILAAGLEAVMVVCELLEKNEDTDFWKVENSYPFVALEGESGSLNEFSVKLMEAPREAVAIPKMPELDQPRIQAILSQHLPCEGVVEVDQFYSAGTIGAKYERKACIRVGLAVDAKTAFAFPPEIGAPEKSTGDLLAEVVLKAIECKRALPAEIQVREPEFRIMLDRLAQALGVSVKVKKSLPALDFAKSELQAMMGDPGVIQ